MARLSFAEFLVKNDRLRRMRDKMQIALAQDARALSDAALAPILDWLDRNPDSSLDDIASVLGDRISLPIRQSQELRDHLAAGQRRMTELRTALFEEAGVSVAGTMSTERLSALYRVDFPKLQQSTSRLIQLVLRQASVSDLPAAPTIYSALRQTGKVRHVAATLANTALAQFDNAYSHEIARAAGIEVFEYTGPAPQRLFCGQHIGKQYNAQEIMGMSNGQGLPVMTSCGGYNCRHTWLPVPPFMVDER